MSRSKTKEKSIKAPEEKKWRMVGFEPVTWLPAVRWFDHWAMIALIQVLDVFSNLFERIDIGVPRHLFLTTYYNNRSL